MVRIANLNLYWLFLRLFYNKFNILIHVGVEEW